MYERSNVSCVVVIDGVICKIYIWYWGMVVEEKGRKKEKKEN